MIETQNLQVLCWHDNRTYMGGCADGTFLWVCDDCGDPIYVGPAVSMLWMKAAK